MPGALSTARSLLLAAVVVVAAVAAAGVVPTPAAATTSASITASPNDAGASATHRATATIGSCEAGDSLNKIRVDYSVGSNPADVSNVGQSDITAVGIDTDGDGAIDKDVSSDLSSVGSSNNGHTLNVGFGGSYSLYDGDTVVIEFADAVNPDSGGTYDVNVSVNYQSDPVCPSTASLSIDGTSASASISADPATEQSSSSHTVQRKVGSPNQGATLDSFVVEYTATNASGLTASDVTTVGLDTDGDGTIDTDLSGDLSGVSVSGETTLTFSFGGSHTLDAGDVLIVSYDGVTNPSAGDYTVSTDINGNVADATLSVTSSTDPSASVSANPTTKNTTATHRATITIGDNTAGDSLNKLRVDYTAGAEPADVSGVGQGDVQAVGIDTDGDGTIDTDVSDDLSSVSASNDGHTLNIGFGGSYSLSSGDTVIVEFAGVRNPNATGTYDVAVSVNYQSDPVTRELDSLSYTDDTTDDTTDGTTDNTTDETTDTTDAGLTAVSSASITATPSTAAIRDATHVVRATVATNGGTSLQTVTVDYTLGSDPADVGVFERGDLRAVGVDADRDGTIDRSLADAVANVSVSNHGETLTIGFADGASIAHGETLVVSYAAVQNPASVGRFDVRVGITGTSQSVEAVPSLRIDSWNATSEQNESTDSTTDGTTTETSVAVSSNGDTTTAVVQDAQGGDSVAMDLSGLAESGGLSVTQVSLTFAERTNATFHVDTTVEDPLPVVGPDLGQFTIEHEAANLSTATITFAVSKEALRDADVEASNVVLVRRQNTTWQSLNTTVAGETNSTYRFEATSPGLSTFAVTARPATTEQKPLFEVSETDVAVERLAASKTVRVTAVVKNVGTERGTYEARLLANGDVVATKSVTVPPGESRTVTFEQTFSDPAVYDVSVGDTDVGAVQVSAPEQTPESVPSYPGTPYVPPVLLVLLGAVCVTGVSTWLVTVR